MAEDEPIDLGKERQRRRTDSILKEVKDYKGPPINLDLREKNISFVPHVIGERQDPAARLTVMCYEVKDNKVGSAMGVVRMRRDQWLEFVAKGNGIFGIK